MGNKLSKIKKKEKRDYGFWLYKKSRTIKLFKTNQICKQKCQSMLNHKLTVIVKAKGKKKQETTFKNQVSYKDIFKIQYKQP